ncbi:hypothetical protein [Haloferula sargassicola]|uniref:Uncharacterized protein n=1 Tax=Haloferula sargassicola TaxID=490096 RepID=A0ABP9UTK1_9BACT
MQHPELAALLRRRLEIIADRDWYARDPAGHLEALKEVSGEITAWHAAHRGTLPARLEHFLTGCSYDKALKYIESDSG